MGDRQHELKCWPHYFERLLDGTKTFEVRHNDRGFRGGDVLWLREWEPGGRGFTGRCLRKRVTFIYGADDDLGFHFLHSDDVVVMALAPEMSYIGHAHPAFVNAAAAAVVGRSPE